MNLKTTIYLLMLVGAGTGLAFWGLQLPPALSPVAVKPVAPDLGTRSELAEWQPDKLQRIEVRAGERVTRLEREPDGSWSLPGKWPIRPAEVKSLVDLVGTLHSRFEPLPLNGDDATCDPKYYGLGAPAAVVKVTVDGKEHTLEFGEARRDEENAFERPTYVRLDGKDEALRLAPGVIRQLDRPVDYYQQRRLFAGKRAEKDGTSQEKVEQLDAGKGTVITLSSDWMPASAVSLTYDGADWKLTKPALDRADPNVVKTLLQTVPDIWAEQFVVLDRLAVPSALAGSTGGLPGAVTAAAWLSTTQPAVAQRWLLARAGLDKPERVLAVTLPGRKKPITLEVGAVSGQTLRTIRVPAPMDPMGMRFPPQEQTVPEDLRYARLKDNDQVFEVRGDRLKDVFVPLDTLRDAHIARFNSADVQEIKITHKGQEIVLARDKERWKLTKPPISADADREKVEDLLSQLAGLEARGKNVSYDADPKETGLDKPSSVIVLSLEEEVKKEGPESKEGKDKDKDKDKRKRTLTLQLGKQEGHNLYVRDTASPRVNTVEAALAGLAARDVLAWRGKRLFNFTATDLEEVGIQRGEDKTTLERKAGKWELAFPVSATADAERANQLASSLGSLEVLEYVNDDPSDKDLETLYGLAKPELNVMLKVADRGKPTQTLQIGRARGPGNGYFGKLAGGKSVFAVSNQVHDQLNRDSLAWRSKRILDLPPTEIERLTIRRGDQTVTLHQEGGAWKLTAPTKADVDSARVGQMAAGLGNLEAVEWVANNAPKDQLGPRYGLDKAALSVTIEPTDKSKSIQKVEFGKARSGKPGLFARLEGSESIFALDTEVRDRFDIDPLTLLPKQLWQMPESRIAQVKTRKGSDEYALARKGADWQITGPFEANADEGRVLHLLQAVAAPHCERYVTFEAKDLADYGLAKPRLQVTVVDRAGKERGLLLGSSEGLKNGEVYGKLVGGSAVFAVNQGLLGGVERSAFDFLDPVLVRGQQADLDRFQMKKGAETLTLERKGKDWQVLDTPASPFTADPGAVSRLEGLWSGLEASRFVAYGPKVDLAQYGLEPDKAEITLVVRTKSPEGKPDNVELRLGKTSDMDGSRYARLANNPAVAILNGRVVSELTRGYLDYVDRTVLKLDAAAGRSLRLEIGPDKVEALKRDDHWVLTKPSEEKADDRAVHQLWSRLADLKALRVAAFPADDLKPFGLDMPAATVVLGLSEDQKPATYTLRIGKPADETSGDRFAQVEGSKTVVVLPGDAVRPLLAGALFLRDRTLVKFASADVLRLERDRRKATFAQVDGTWKLTEPLKADADQDELEEFVNALARLRADELVQEKPTPEELKNYGLDKPEVRWQAFSGDREVLDLQVGAVEKGGPRRYARIAGKDLVFLLDPRLTIRALGEFRPRTVWNPPLDASQIDAIRFGFQKDPFTLERSGGAWQAREKPDAPVAPELVNETLATLAGLKLERYVVDKDADMQLFGLKTPELVLEATTRTGKRVLQIGSREGDSHRRYVHVSEPGRTDVFLISAADADKLVRDLAAFGKTK